MPPTDSPDLDRARDLPSLATAAEAAGHDLGVRVASVLGELDLSVRVEELILRWRSRVPDLTLSALLRERPPVQVTLAARAEILRAVREWLTAAAAARSGPPPVGGVSLPTRLTAAGLDAWATRHQMHGYLAVRVDRLAPYAAPGHAPLLRWADWLDVRTALLSAARSHVPASLRSAIRGTLERLAAAIEEACAEEASTRRVLPEEPPLAAVVAALQARRAQLRATAHPMGARSRAAFPIRVDADLPALVVTAAASLGCGSRHEASVVLALEPAEDANPVRCACAPAPAACPARIGAIDRALDVLADPAHPIRGEVERLLAGSPWERALARLERLTAPPSQHVEPVGWRLERRGEMIVPAPVTSRPAKSGRGHVLTAMPAYRVREVGEEQDLAVFDALGLSPYVSPRSDDPRAAQRALRALVGHPRVFYERTLVAVVEVPWTIRVDGAGDGARVTVREGGVDRSPRDFLATPGPALAGGLGVRLEPEAGRVVLLPLPPAALQTLQALARVPSEYPPEAVAPLLKVLDTWRGRVPLALSGALRGEPMAPPRRLEVRLALPAPGVLRLAFRVRPLPGGEAHPPGEGPPEPFGVVDGRRVCVPRDFEDERARLAAAWEGIPGDPTPDVELADPEVALAWLERLPGLDAVDVTWEGAQKWKVGGQLSASNVRLRGRDARSWFAVDGSVEVDEDTIPLSTLLAAVRERRTYVALGAGRWARLTESLRGQVEALGRGQAQGEGIEVSPVLLPLVDALVQAGAQVEGSAAMLGILERLRTADDAPVDPPAGLRADLRPYQQEGHRFLARLARWAPGAVLADDMGLGKTLQALALLLDRAEEGPALVVAPTSVGFNWVRESERFAPSLRTRPWRGADRRAQLADLGPGDVIVTSYELVQRDAAALGTLPFASVVLDEAQAVKNAATRRWKAIEGLKRGFTLALTGTPVENRLDELWALTALVVPGLFGGAQGFRATWGAPVERDGDDDVRRALSRRLRPFLLRRTKAAVAPELPERTIVDVVVPLEAEERRLYDEVRKGALLELGSRPDEPAAQARIRVLAALTALRRVACHPGLHDPSWTGATSKLDRVRELVAELRAEGHKALLFSQFVGHLAKVRAALEADGVSVRSLDGSTPEATRRAEVDAFQRGEGDVFLISLKAGGTGLNLTAATYVLHLDPWWNPAVEDQATDRAHRIGQTRAVTVYRVVAAGTVEEQILRLHEDKRRLVAGVLEGTDAGARLGADDLLALLRGEEPAAPAPAPPAPAPPAAPPEWTAARLLAAVERQLHDEVASGRVAASSAATYLGSLRGLLGDEGAAEALSSPETFEAFVRANTRTGPSRTVGMRAVRMLRAGA